MGRKIPGKKHRGIKDLFKQQAKRHAELETKINSPPESAEQAIPRSLERVVKLKEAVKSSKIAKIKKKKKKKNTLIIVGKQDSKPLHSKARPEKVVPVFQQKPGEIEESFLLNRNPETGKIEGLSKCEKTELDKIEMLRMKHTNIRKKKKKKHADEPKLINSKRFVYAPTIGFGPSKKPDRFTLVGDECVKDQVKFGEVAHEPPQFKVRPKYANATSTNKPGKKELLLHSILKKSDKVKMNDKKTVCVDRSGKRKNLPLGERRQLEKQQSDVIATYRMLKVEQSAGVNN
ncbi:hypothetical protein WN51_00311 [Melipona quadrifasciata]|uniref:Coiled-coil domain-containing protein 137 n=1 Tax=Melipona quadrifasciata TaxID=166423 RepID=A0A0N1ITK3_9HYME|nr:hypothetical protein WN51_00311 [Melipona quadrifasciata]